jgi:hypothetical protein
MFQAKRVEMRLLLRNLSLGWRGDCVLTRTVFLGKLIGFYLLFFALYLLVQPRTALATLTDFIQSPTLVLLCAILAVTAGLAIILNHNVWKGGAFPVVVTIIGWLALIKGLVLLLLPPSAQIAYWGSLRFSQLYYGCDGAMFVIAIYLLSSAFAARTSAS